MTKNNLFICSSYWHILVSQIFIDKHQLVNVELLLTNKINLDEKYIDKSLFININEYIFLKMSKKELFIYSLKESIISIFKKKRVYNTIFLFDDKSVDIQILLNKLIFKNVIYLEHGLTSLLIESGYMESKNYSLRSKFLRFLFKQITGISIWNNYLENNILSSVYILLPRLLKKQYKFPIHDIGEILIEEKEYINTLANLVLPNTKYKNPDYLILTSLYHLPTDMILPILKFVESIDKNKKILIKFHPNDNPENYKTLLEYDNLLILEGYNNIPYELLHANLKPKNIVSYFSTVMFTSPYFYNCNIISLLKCIDIPATRQFVEIIEKTNQYGYSDIKFVEV